LLSHEAERPIATTTTYNNTTTASQQQQDTTNNNKETLSSPKSSQLFIPHKMQDENVILSRIPQDKMQDRITFSSCILHPAFCAG